MRKLLAIATALGLLAVIVPLQASAAESAASTPAAKTTVSGKAKTAVKHKHRRATHVRHGKKHYAKRHHHHRIVRNQRQRHHVRHAQVAPSSTGSHGR
jgi:purine nucleoside phosphorylase